MQYKKPKNDNKYEWTNHVIGKMAYYRISESLIKRIVRFPKRVEKGIAPGTTACMQPRKIATRSRGKPAVRQEEIWVMWLEVGRGPTSNHQLSTINYQQKKKIITAWRYPGISPIGEPIPIPEEILAEINHDQ